MRAPVLATALVSLALAPAPAGAHGVGWRVSADKAVVLDLHYADGEAMPYADVQVFAPGEEVAFLHGRADRLGKASFVPDRDGGWRVVARDAEGHSLRATVPVLGAAAAPGAPAGRFPWLLWGSLTLNVLWAATWWNARSRNP